MEKNNRLKNYFTIKGPVPTELFFDRRKEVAFLTNLMDREAYDVLISVIAPFRFGKTSLLKKYISIISNYENTIPIYFPSKLKKDFIKTMKEILSRRIPDASRLEIENRNDIASFFEKINRLLEEHNLWAIMVIDEFQEIPAILKSQGYMTVWSNKDIFECFRGITEEFRIGLIVSGSYIGKLLDAISLWNGRFIEQRLGPFPREDSIIMLKTLFNMSGLEANDEVVEYIAMSTKDHPYYMQLFGYKLVELGEISDEYIERARKFVLDNILSLFQKKYRELKEQGSKYIDTLIKISNGITLISEYPDEEWEILLELERAGIIYNYGTRIEITDKLFEEFIMNKVSRRNIEKVIPEYTAEYIISRKLAYEEKLKEVLISYRSWGPFDIVILKKLDQYKGIGIQVKSTTKTNIQLSREELKHISETATELNLIPIIAVMFKTLNRIKYFHAEETKTTYHENEGNKTLHELIKNIESPHTPHNPPLKRSMIPPKKL